MSEDLPETGDEGTHDVRQMRARLKERDAELAEARAQAAETEALRRRLMFAEAGVDVTNPTAKYFLAGYDGENDPDAIKAAWNALKSAGTQQAAPPPVDRTPEIDAMQRITDASTGAPAPGGGDNQAQYLAELQAIQQATRDPYVAQQLALEVMNKYGVKTTRDYQ